MLGYEEAIKIFEYDEHTGVIKWVYCAANRRRGKTVGSRTRSGHLELSYKRQRLYAHRLAWLLANGDWPKGHIDHINGDPADNRLVNLRDVNNADNHKNMKRHFDNSSGTTGIYFNKRAKKWQAYICVKGKQMYLGVFKDIDEAIKVRKQAEVEYGFHANHGRT